MGLTRELYLSNHLILFLFLKDGKPNAGDCDNENDGISENITNGHHGFWKPKNGDPNEYETKPKSNGTIKPYRVFDLHRLICLLTLIMSV